MSSFWPVLKSLDPLYRLVVTTDGTLTEMLEALSLEKMCLVKLSQDVGPATDGARMLDLRPEETLLVREILLRGERSSFVYLHARTLIALNRLSESLRKGLLETNTPLGLLLKQNRVETFKEVVDLRQEPAGDLHRYFEVDHQAPLLVRTSRVYFQGQPVMWITEHLSLALPGNGRSSARAG